MNLRILTAILGLGVSMSLTPLAAAQPAPAQPASALGDLRSQLDEDITPVPAGMGAIFVPSLTGGDQEPLITVTRKGRRIASGRTGERVVLPPGTYEVAVASGPVGHRAQTTVEVQEGVTTPVAPFFGALRVSIVDRKGAPVASEYVIAAIGGAGSAVYGPFETQAGSDFVPGATLLLRPGSYVVAVGDDPSTSEGRFDLRVAPGEVMRYRLVVDDAESLLRAELAESELVYEPSIWRLRWLLGVNAVFGMRSDTLTGYNGGVLMIDGITRFEAGVDTGDHLALFTLRANQSLIGLDSQSGLRTPVQSLANDASAELAYTYRAGSIFGPYARAIAWTAFAPNGFYPGENSTVTTRDEAGGVVSSELVEKGERIDMMEPFAPTILQQGAGLSLTPVDNRRVSLLFRGGMAARQSFYQSGRYLAEVDGARVDMLRLDDRQDFGPEATIGFGIRLGRSFTYETRLDGFIPGGQIVDGESFKPLFQWDNTAALTLSSFASLVYEGSLRQQHLAVDPLQTSHTMAVRLQYSVF